MLFNSPLSPGKADRLVSLLDVARGSRVLDVGCGCGEFLIRVVEASGACGLGVDVDGVSIAAARARAAARIPGADCEFRESDIQSESLAPDSFDLAICIGATHAHGKGESAYPNTLSALLRQVRGGGMILVGEGYWKREPDPEYLAFLGDPAGVYRSHAENVGCAEQQGLVPLYATVSNDDEWDDFEWSHRMKFERQALRQPDDPKIQDQLDRSREWREAYLRWGRTTMGFGFYLFMKPES